MTRTRLALLLVGLPHVVRGTLVAAAWRWWPPVLRNGRVVE